VIHDEFIALLVFVASAVFILVCSATPRDVGHIACHENSAQFKSERENNGSL